MDPILYLMWSLLVTPIIIFIWAVTMLIIDDCRMPKSRARRIKKARRS